MLFHIIVGALAMLTLVLLMNHTKKSSLVITWWQWLLTVLGVGYSVFVLEAIYGFVMEGEPQAALVMGLITGIVAVIWGVLMTRFVFMKKTA